MSQDATDKVPLRGRPSQGKSGAFKFRVTASLREKLEAEAQAIDRPVSEVIEARLNASFEEDARAAKESPAARRMGRILMRVWQDFDEIFGPEWADHESGRAAMRYALMETIRFGVPVKPDGDLTEGDKREIAQLQEVATSIVNVATHRFFDPKAAYVQNRLLAAAIGPATFVDTHNLFRKARRAGFKISQEFAVPPDSLFYIRKQELMNIAQDELGAEWTDKEPGRWMFDPEARGTDKIRMLFGTEEDALLLKLKAG